ncbi:MAG: uroporphyrinogen decarboxylase family protein [Desulfobacterales bacterium]
MNAKERMNAAINLQPVDRVPNAPFYEAPICTYFGTSFRAALLEAQAMADAHLAAVEAFEFDWVMVGMGLIGGIIPEALGCEVNYPEDVFPIIEKTPVNSIADIEAIAKCNVLTRKMEAFLKGIEILKQKLDGEVPIACEYISPFTIATRLRGTTAIMEDFYDDPRLLSSLQEALVPIDIEIGRALIEAGVEYIFYGADMECPLLISPDHYRNFVHPSTSQVVNALAAEGARVLPHMCGDIIKTGIVDMLMEMDIHGIMPGNLTQETVLDLRELKDKCGDRMCIFDNLNPNGSLLIGSPEEVAQETRAHLQRAGSMSGYIFSTSGTTSPVTPRENFAAMNSEVLNFTMA